MARVTLQTVADEVGVSRMTVSNAFSRPDQLSAALRERILAAAEELGYVGPDPAARALARGTTGAVGVLLTESLRYAFTDEVAKAFLGAIGEELEPTGLALTLLSTAERGDVVPARDVAIDGALVYSCEPQSPAVGWLLKRRLPLVFVDQASAAGIPSVNVDDRGGARAAAQHVVDLGHRRVGIVTTGVVGPYGVVDDPLAVPEGHVSRERLRGWLEPLRAAGIEPTAVRVPFDSAEQIADGARLLLGADDRPTAVLCFSDAVALEVVTVAGELGLAVPGDLSVVGFDDNPLARRMRPPLTTVRQDVTGKGREAAAALRAAMARAGSAGTARARHVLLPTELVVRGSTAPPR